MTNLRVKVLSRDPLRYERQSLHELRRVERNPSPQLHPHAKAREYVRALNAVKWEKLFAKPFLGALSDHVDTVNCLAKHPTTLTLVGAADCAGELRIWNIPQQRAELFIPKAHTGLATGMVFTPDGAAFLSCGHDQAVRLWRPPGGTVPPNLQPQAEFAGEHAFDCIDYNLHRPQFVTAGQDLEFWDVNRTRPLHTFTWGEETINRCSYSRTQSHLLVCCMRDRAVCVYDTRSHQAVQKLYLPNRSGAVTWNPMRPTDFAVANEDSMIYLLDCRRLDRARGILKGHVHSVLSVDYSPTGWELVSGSFDKTVRLWKLKSWHDGVSRDVYAGKRMARVWELVSGSFDKTVRLWKLKSWHDGVSRDVYAGKRMARVWGVAWTADNNFVLSASDDCNIRLWKAYSSQPLKRLEAREARALEYNNKLKERFRDFPEIARISKQRPVPMAVRKLQRKRRVMAEAQERREARSELNGGEARPHVPLKKARILAVTD